MILWWATAGTGGAVLGVHLHDRAARVWALQLELDSGFPITYPRTFDAPPLRLSSLDLTPDGTALGAVLYEGRLLEAPIAVSSGLDEFDAQRAGETLRFRAVAAPRVGGVDLHGWVAAEHRGKPVDGWLVDLDPTTLAPSAATRVFTGELAAMADDPGSVDMLVRVFDAWALTQPMPPIRITSEWAPYAPAASLEQVVPHGIGIGRRILCHCVKTRSADDTLSLVPVTVSAASDTLTIAAGHDWATGDGPVRVTATGTVPGGLAPGVDYFVVVVDDVTIRLATTRGNALAGTTIDLTSTGTGTVSVAAGIAPNLDEHTDFVVGVGNVCVTQVWLDGETESPEWPLDYQVLTQTYRAGGRYLTVLRFPGDLQGTVVEADVLRVDPEVDGSCLLDCKFARGFADDARGIDPVPADGTTTADLVMGAHRFGLGALVTTGSLLLSTALQGPAGTLHVIWTAPFGADPVALVTNGAVSLSWDGTVQGLVLTAYYPYNGAVDPETDEQIVVVNGESYTLWTWQGVPNSLLRGATVDALVTWTTGSATSTVSLSVDGTPVVTRTKARRLAFVAAPQAGPLAGTTLHRLRAWARPYTAVEQSTAWWRWRRNGVQWLSELLESAGFRVDPVTTATARAAWADVESGALTVDGWMSQETDLRSALFAVARMRGVRFSVAPERVVTIVVPTAAASTTAALGHGDALGNLTALPQRVRASLTEAPRDVVVRFRVERTNGASSYARSITRSVFPAGATTVEVELPFVDDPASADIVADWLAKRYNARDQLVVAETGRDARSIQVGDRVALVIPRMQIDWDAECIGLERGAHRHLVRLTPWASSAFSYTAAPWPPDPVSPLFEPPSIGDAPYLTATWLAGRVRLEVVPADARQLLPLADATAGQSGPSVGTLAPWPFWSQVDETPPDDDTTIVEWLIPPGVNPGIDSFWVSRAFLWPEFTGGTAIARVDVSLRARALRVATVDEPPRVRAIVPRGALIHRVTEADSPLILATPDGFGGWNQDTTWRTKTWSLAQFHEFDGSTWTQRNWTPELLNAATWGFEIEQTPSDTYGDGVWLTAQWLTVYQRIVQTRPSWVRFWRVGPSATQPATPAESVAPVTQAADFGTQVDDPGGTTGDRYWYWARVYDALGRLVATLGPASITVG